VALTEFAKMEGKLMEGPVSNSWKTKWINVVKKKRKKKVRSFSKYARKPRDLFYIYPKVKYKRLHGHENKAN
jgi:hypothetical protein